MTKEEKSLGLRAGIMVPRTLGQFEHAFCPLRSDPDGEREVIPLFESEPEKRSNLMKHFNSNECYENRLAMLPPKRLKTAWLMETLTLGDLIETAVIDVEERTKRDQKGGFFKVLITEGEVAEAQKRLGRLVARAVVDGDEEKIFKRLRVARDFAFLLNPEKERRQEKLMKDQANPPQRRQVYLAVVAYVREHGALPSSRALCELFSKNQWAANPGDNAPTILKEIGFWPLPKT